MISSLPLAISMLLPATLTGAELSGRALRKDLGRRLECAAPPSAETPANEGVALDAPVHDASDPPAASPEHGSGREGEADVGAPGEQDATAVASDRGDAITSGPHAGERDAGVAGEGHGQAQAGPEAGQAPSRVEGGAAAPPEGPRGASTDANQERVRVGGPRETSRGRHGRRRRESGATFDGPPGGYVRSGEYRSPEPKDGSDLTLAGEIALPLGVIRTGLGAATLAMAREDRCLRMWSQATPATCDGLRLYGYYGIGMGSAMAIAGAVLLGVGASQARAHRAWERKYGLALDAAPGPGEIGVGVALRF